MVSNNIKADIVIIDDIPENLHLLSSILMKRGYKTRLFPNGVLALDSIYKFIPDLILLDINMPDLNGYEVCKLLKKNKKLKDIPVIFISALSESFDKLRAFSVGGVDYITKPFEVKEVEARIETHLKINRLQKDLENHNKNLIKLVNEKVKEIANAQTSTIIAIVNLAEARDDDTGKHIERTSEFCQFIALKLLESNNYTEIITDEFINDIRYASPLHDVGKIAIPDNILLKPGKLTPEEFEIMKNHTVYGSQTLAKVKEQYPNNSFINMGIRIALYHHEKWDGSGYPEGLKANEIPLEARIMALADVYDALRSKRIYKEAFSHEKSKKIIEDGRGTHFDPEIIDIFIKYNDVFDNIREGMNDY